MFKRLLFVFIILLSSISISYSYTNISACGSISVAGDYKLNKSLSSPGATCLTITANNVDLDCQGHSIIGNGAASTYGIVFATDYINISNCVINDFDTGIVVSIGSQYSILNNITSTNSASGVAYNQCTPCHSKLYNSNLSKNSLSGAYFYAGGQYLSFENNSFSENQYGIYTWNMEYLNITNCSFLGNTDYGVVIQRSRYTITRDSYFNNNNNYDYYINEWNNIEIGNYFYNNNFTDISKVDVFLPTSPPNYGYTTINGKYLGNWWRANPTACADTSNNDTVDYKGYRYTVCIGDFAVGAALDKGVILKKELIPPPQANYVSPTPNNNADITSLSPIINMTYDGQSITNCQLNLANGSTYSMTDGSTYCYSQLSLNVLNTYTYNVSYELSSTTYYLQNRVLNTVYSQIGYVFPTPNNNAKVTYNNVTINMTYDGESISNCQLNLNNGSSYPMTDASTSCYEVLSLSNNGINSYTYNVSYDLSSTNYYLDNRIINSYPPIINSQSIPSIGIGSLILSTLIFFLVLFM